MRWWPFGKRDADLERELEADLELEEEEQRERGVPAEEARYAARRAFGNPTLIREQTHQVWGWGCFERLWQDSRFALRQLRKSPGFAATSVLILAISIGAVSAIFSILYAVLLRPYSFRDPNQIVVWREVIEDAVKQYTSVPDNYRHFVYLRSHAKTIQDAALFQNASFSVTTGGDHPHIEKGLTVSPNFFSVLGVTPVLGRAFRAEEAEPGKNGVILLSWAAWQDLFHGDRGAVGRTVDIRGEPATVIGVLPHDFEFPVMNEMNGGASPDQTSPHAIFQPFVPQGEDLTSDDADFAFLVIGRLEPNITRHQASTELSGLLGAYAAANHLSIHLGAVVEPFSQEVMSNIGKALWLLLAAVLGLLLIACVNLASLQVARSIKREREQAIRAALGAGRARFLQAALIESVLLCLIGGSLGVPLAFGGIRLFPAIAPENIPRLDEIHISWVVLLFACGASGIAALLSGIFSAVRSFRSKAQHALQSASMRISGARQTTRIRELLIGIEIACTVALLIVTGLVLRSFSRVLNQRDEFDASKVIVAEVDLLNPRYEQPNDSGASARSEFIERILGEIRSMPGVESASITSEMPLRGNAAVHSMYRPDHPLPESAVPTANLRNVSPGYFAAMRTGLVAGQDFNADERATPQSAIVSQKAAQAAWPHMTALGRKMKFDGRLYTVIGIAADARVADLKENIPVVYLPYWHDPPTSVFFLVRTSRNRSEFASTFRHLVWSVDSEAAIPMIEMLEKQLTQSIAPERLQSVVLSSFGVAALILAILGVYGMLTYSVSLRTPELGIRIALGSSRFALICFVLREAVMPVGGGILAGLLASIAITRGVRSLLYKTSLADPLSIAGSVGLLVFTTFVAAFVPAYRACRIDPMNVLRSE